MPPLCSERPLPSGVDADTHLLGWGSGTDPTTADDLARAEIAKTFSVTIEQVAQSRQQATMQRDESGVVTTARTDQRSDTKSATRATLTGVEIAEQWRNGDHQCSLAVLARDRSAEPLLEALSQHDRFMEQQLLQSKQASNPISAVHHLNTALARTAERAVVIQTLRILDRLPERSVNSFTAQLQAERSNMLTSARVQLSAPDVPQVLVASINAALTATGLAPSDSGRITVRGTMALTPNGPDDYGFHHSAATLKIQFTGPNGEILSEYSVDGRASSQTRRRASEDAIAQLQARFDDSTAGLKAHIIALLNQGVAS